MRKLFFFGMLAAILVLKGCTTSFGEKYTIGNLEIFYTEEIGENYVERLGDYFDRHGLIQPEKHSVQLTSDPDSFILKMILNDSYTALPGEANDQLALLEAEIRQEVFDGLNFKIMVCDAYFNPIKAPDNK